VHAFFGLPVAACMLLVAIIVISYTIMGGLWADTLLDFIQMFLTAGGITLIFVSVLNAVGGWEGLAANGGSLYVSKPFTLMPIEGEGYLGYQGGLGWTYWLGAWMALGLGSIAAQDLMQRSMSENTEF
jgi:Na+/proline symporter